jgi:hypothetical protein
VWVGGFKSLFMTDVQLIPWLGSQDHDRPCSVPFVIVGNRISIVLSLALKTCCPGLSSVPVHSLTPQIRSQDGPASTAFLISTSVRYAYR